MAKVIKVLKKFSEKNADNTDLLCWNFLKLNSYSRSHYYQHLIVNFHVKIFFRYFHSNPEIPQVNVILGVQIERNFGKYFCTNPLQSAAAVGRKHSGRNFQSFKPFNQTRVDQKCRSKKIKNVHFSFLSTHGINIPKVSVFSLNYIS